MNLRDYQQKGVSFLLLKKKCILGDDMGLGKTAQAINAIKIAQAYPCLIVCPASLKINWRREIDMWDSEFYPNNDRQYHVQNYDMVHKDSKIMLTKWRSIILDESHYVKNKEAKRSKIIDAVIQAHNPEYIFLLSGTAIENRPAEIINQLKLIGRLNQMGGWLNFVKTYCKAYRRNVGTRIVWDTSGASNMPMLREKMRPFYMRRTKGEVLTELPDINRQVLWVEAASPTYNMIERSFVAWLMKETEGLTEKDQFEKINKTLQAEMLCKISALRQQAARDKMPYIIEWVKDFLETTDRKLIIFGYHREIIQTLLDNFVNPCVLIGDMTSLQRQENIDRFQNDPAARLFITSIPAGGTGITLTAASDILFVELDWSPAKLDQAESRVHRMGQRKGVNVYYMLGAKTIDEKMWKMLEKKKNIIDTVLSPMDLINEYK